MFCILYSDKKINKRVKSIYCEIDENFCFFEDDEDNMIWLEVLKYMFECVNFLDLGFRSCVFYIFG